MYTIRTNLVIIKSIPDGGPGGDDEGDAAHPALQRHRYQPKAANILSPVPQGCIKFPKT